MGGGVRRAGYGWILFLEAELNRPWYDTAGECYWFDCRLFNHDGVCAAAGPRGSERARAISPCICFSFCFGLLMWLIYGLMIHSLLVILANLVTLGIALAILALKIRYD